MTSACCLVKRSGDEGCKKGHETEDRARDISEFLGRLDATLGGWAGRGRGQESFPTARPAPPALLPLTVSNMNGYR